MIKGAFSVDEIELRDILLTVLALSVALAIATNGLGVLFVPNKLILLMVVFSVAVGMGFVLHEMGHKLVAIAYGAKARFVMWPQGLLLMFVTSLFGFIFAAPGAVYIMAKNITKEENGIISLAGPLMNVFLALIFAFFYAFSPYTFFPINPWLLGAYINALLALFNCLPIGPLDGGKIMAWNFIVWLGLVIVSGFLFLDFGSQLALDLI